jgi:hypothetical protein
MPFAIGGDTPIWQRGEFASLFGDAFLDTLPRKVTTPAAPEEKDCIPEKNVEKLAKGQAPPVLVTCRPIQGTMEFFGKMLNNIHGLIPKSMDGVFEAEMEAVRKVESTFTAAVSHCESMPELSQNEIETERFLQNFIRRIRTLAVGDVALIPAGWANQGPQIKDSITELNAERVKDPKLPNPAVVALAQGMHVGMAHYILLVIDRPRTDYFRLAIINQTPGCGLEYHPSSASQQPYIKRKLTLVIDEIPFARLHDSSWWFLLFKMQIWPLDREMHAGKFFYETLLPYLNSKPLYANMIGDKEAGQVGLAAASSSSSSSLSEGQPETDLAEWRVLSRNGDPFHVQIGLEALSYMLRIMGVDRAKTKYFVNVIFKQSCVRTALMDLNSVPSITPSDAYLLQIATKQLSFSTARASMNVHAFPPQAGDEKLGFVTAIRPEHVHGVHKLIDEVNDRLHAIYASPNLNSNTLTLSSTIESNSLASSRWMPYPLMDRLKRDESVEHLAGGAKIPLIYRPVELTKMHDRM